MLSSLQLEQVRGAGATKFNESTVSCLFQLSVLTYWTLWVYVVESQSYVAIVSLRTLIPRFLLQNGKCYLLNLPLYFLK